MSAACNRVIADINDTVLEAFFTDVAALVKHWQSLPTAGEIHTRLIMDRDGCLKAEFTINGQLCSAERPMFRS